MMENRVFTYFTALVDEFLAKDKKCLLVYLASPDDRSHCSTNLFLSDSELISD